MTMTQTIDIPANRRVTLPRKIPVGATIITFTPVVPKTAIAFGVNKPEQGINAALRRAQGAWKNNPWTNHLEDVNAMRNEWEQRN